MDLTSRTPSAQRIFEAAVSEGDAAWFRDADLLVQGPNDIPVDALQAAEALGIGSDEALAHVRRAWGRVDTAERERIGAAGEVALVRLLEVAAIGRVEHVTATSDGFGYDIALHAARYSAHIEVKATTRRGRLTVHLSRSEYEVMRRDAMWVLVAVRLTEDLEPAAIGTVASEWIAAHVPTDQGSHGRWSSCALDVPPSAILSGKPNIAPALGTRSASLMFAGIPAWPG